MNDILFWLQDYYRSLCDGEWEHAFGFKIDTLDNPGWSVEFNLECTFMEGKEFQPVKIERSKDDWIHCKVEKKIFRADGGPLNLIEILLIFRDWVEKNKI